MPTRSFSICRPSVRPPTFPPRIRPLAESRAARQSATPPPAPRGPTLQSLPPAANPAPSQAQRPTPPRRAQLALAARYGSNLPQITGGLHWRIYPVKPDQGGAFRPLKEDRAHRRCSRCRRATTSSMSASVSRARRGRSSCAPTARAKSSRFPPAACASPAASATRASRPGQVWFDLFPGSQFEPGDRRAIVQSVAAGDVILVPDGSYHIVSHYGDGNSVVRSDIRVQTGKLIDAVVTHRAAIITLKLVSQYGGEARANTQWSVLTPGGDVVKESIGAFPRVILAEGEYRAVARSDDREKPYERTFRVVTGVDTEVEVLAR